MKEYQFLMYSKKPTDPAIQAAPISAKTEGFSPTKIKPHIYPVATPMKVKKLYIEVLSKGIVKKRSIYATKPIKILNDIIVPICFGLPDKSLKPSVPVYAAKAKNPRG